MEILHELRRRIAAGRTDLVFELAGIRVAALFEADAGTFPIQWCAYYGDVSAVRLLLQHGERLERLGDDLGLNAAAFHGHWRLCQFLLEHGAAVDTADPVTGETPLHSALVSEDRLAHDEVVRVLLRSGADVNRPTRPGRTTGAFMRDARTRGESPLHRAAAFGSLDTIRCLLQAGARIDARDAHGDTPLSWASWHRRPVEVLRTLCFAEHRIHDRHRGMRVHLVGNPYPGDTGP